MTKEREPLATITTYEQLVEALRRRTRDLQVATGTIGEIAGIGHNGVAKVLAGWRVIGPRWLPLVLGALAVRLELVHDGEQYDRLRHRFVKRSPGGAKIRRVRKPLHGRERPKPAAAERP